MQSQQWGAHMRDRHGHARITSVHKIVIPSSRREDDLPVACVADPWGGEGREPKTCFSSSRTTDAEQAAKHNSHSLRSWGSVADKDGCLHASLACSKHLHLMMHITSAHYGHEHAFTKCCQPSCMAHLLRACKLPAVWMASSCCRSSSALDALWLLCRLRMCTVFPADATQQDAGGRMC